MIRLIQGLGTRQVDMTQFDMDDLLSRINHSSDRSLEPIEKLNFPKLFFHMDMGFGHAGKVIAREFLVDLNELSGSYIWPFEIEDACIFIRTCCNKTHDYLGRDFRHLFLKNPEYHALFAEYAVNSIYFHGFPKASNYDTRFLLGESGVPFEK